MKVQYLLGLLLLLSCSRGRMTTTFLLKATTAPPVPPVISNLDAGKINRIISNEVTVFEYQEPIDKITCEAFEPENVTIDTACTCQLGKCSVRVSNPTKTSAAGFSFKITVNDLTSNEARASFAVVDEAFISKWRVDSSDKTVTLPLRVGYTYDARVDWGDGSPISEITSPLDSDKSHTYAEAGDYIITITGTFATIYFNNSGDRLKIIEVLDLGKVGWTSLTAAFHGCENLEAVYGGDVSQVTSLSSVFQNASSLVNGDIGNWDVSNVKSINYAFQGATLFNLPLNDWDTSNVINSVSTFQDAVSFNQPLDKWVMAQNPTMIGMFRNAQAFNQNIRIWDVSSATLCANFSLGSNPSWTASRKPVFSSCTP